MSQSLELPSNLLRQKVARRLVEDFWEKWKSDFGVREGKPGQELKHDLYFAYPASKEERVKKAKENLESTLKDLSQVVQNILEDETGDQQLMRIVSGALLMLGLFALGLGLTEGQPLALFGGGATELLIYWPYGNLRRIRQETTFLRMLVPNLRMQLATCESAPTYGMVFDCYVQKAMKPLATWMEQLRKKAYG